MTEEAPEPSVLDELNEVLEDIEDWFAKRYTARVEVEIEPGTKLLLMKLDRQRGFFIETSKGITPLLSAPLGVRVRVVGWLVRFEGAAEIAQAKQMAEVRSAIRDARSFLAARD